MVEDTNNKIKEEFEISIGLHNCNKLLPFCCEMLGKELKPEMDTLNESMETMKKELIDKTHELVGVKLELANFKEDN